MYSLSCTANVPRVSDVPEWTVYLGRYIRARTAGPPGLALWHEPSRQIGRASDDVQTLFYVPNHLLACQTRCMAREWKKSRLGRPPHAPLSVCASSMSPVASPVASRGGIAIQSWTRGKAALEMLYLYGILVWYTCSIYLLPSPYKAQQQAYLHAYLVHTAKYLRCLYLDEYAGDDQPQLMHPNAQWSAAALQKRDDPKQRPTICRSRQVRTTYKAARVLPVAS